MSEEIATRNPAQELAARVRSDQFKEQVALALPENVKPERFVRATVTALLQNPALADADPDSIFASLLRSAQDGLVPDGREAALVIFGKKAQYMPMIAGFRKIAAEHDWAIRSAVVHEADTFEYELGLDTRLVHRPARPGVERGPLIAAYAVGVNRDGRREFEVMYAPDIEKVRQVSRSKDRGPWVDWPERMAEKTVARRLFAKLPLDRSDVRVSRLLAADELDAGAATDLLYGPDGQEFTATPAGEQPGSLVPPSDTAAADAAAAGVAAGTDETSRQQAEPTDASPVGSAPGADEDDPEPQPATKPDYGATVVPSGAYQDMTLTAVADLGEDGEKWLTWAARNKGRFDQDFATALLGFIEDQLKAAA